MSDKIIFTEEQVERLKDYQKSGRFHPFTCCSFEGCERSPKNDWGVLIPTTQGWICPCGKYTQDWAHQFMMRELPEDPFQKFRN